MNILQVFENHLLINALVSWLVAQVIKTIIYAIVNRTLDFHRLVGDGGMPSAHSATVTALAVTAGLQCGFDSPVFAVAATFAIVVMHDAMGVRLEAGKHAQMLNELFEMVMGNEAPDIKLKEFLGHTPSQVVCGAALGLVLALLLG